MKYNFLKYLILIGFLTVVTGLRAQKAWIDPGGTDFNPDDSVNVCVNVAETERPQLKDFAGDVYFWSWLPAEDTGPYKHGGWNSTSDEVKMTRQADPNVYCIKIIPTEFYNTSASDVYDKGFAFLAKAKDGADVGNGEMKTEDLIIQPEKPGVPKVFTLPAVPKSLKKATDTAIDTLPVNQDDFITVFYNNKLETVTEMQNLATTEEIHVFIRTTGSDNKIYSNVRKAQLGNDAKSKMRAVTTTEGLFALTFNLGAMWRASGTTAAFTAPPAGVTPQRIEIQFAKVNAAQPSIDLAPKAEGLFFYFVGKCQ